MHAVYFSFAPPVSITIPLFPALYSGKLVSIYIVTWTPLPSVSSCVWPLGGTNMRVKGEKTESRFLFPTGQGFVNGCDLLPKSTISNSRLFDTATTPSKFSTHNLSIHQALFRYLFKCAFSYCTLSCICYTLSCRVSLGNFGHHYVENELEAAQLQGTVVRNGDLNEGRGGEWS